MRRKVTPSIAIFPSSSFHLNIHFILRSIIFSLVLAETLLDWVDMTHGEVCMRAEYLMLGLVVTGIARRVRTEDLYRRKEN